MLKSDQQIAQEAANFDSGFCNPIKIDAYNENYIQAVWTLQDRGYSYEEAEQMISECSSGW